MVLIFGVVLTSGLLLIFLCGVVIICCGVYFADCIPNDDFLCKVLTN